MELIRGSMELILGAYEIDMREGAVKLMAAEGGGEQMHLGGLRH